ncbi:hypothetical protein C8R45DRAFT_934022 [Mycena sanguinolenta]|nr:hypothetical protein C8R45DRAFT_934022 [Mycena sanguinolenta]
MTWVDGVDVMLSRLPDRAKTRNTAFLNSATALLGQIHRYLHDRSTDAGRSGLILFSKNMAICLNHLKTVPAPICCLSDLNTGIKIFGGPCRASTIHYTSSSVDRWGAWDKISVYRLRNTSLSLCNHDFLVLDAQRNPEKLFDTPRSRKHDEDLRQLMANPRQLMGQARQMMIKRGKHRQKLSPQQNTMQARRDDEKVRQEAHLGIHSNDCCLGAHYSFSLTTIIPGACSLLPPPFSPALSRQDVALSHARNRSLRDCVSAIDSTHWCTGFRSGRIAFDRGGNHWFRLDLWNSTTVST